MNSNEELLENRLMSIRHRRYQLYTMHNNEDLKERLVHNGTNNFPPLTHGIPPLRCQTQPQIQFFQQAPSRVLSCLKVLRYRPLVTGVFSVERPPLTLSNDASLSHLGFAADFTSKPNFSTPFKPSVQGVSGGKAFPSLLYLEWVGLSKLSSVEVQFNFSVKLSWEGAGETLLESIYRMQ
ncbi:hypothetical protein CEXT_40121 [Caerostris extrusa]|uniref:Ribosomal protein S4 n=1 Tax=Caerostris extrusa TaxID=172846 RepID=A0AAV4MQ58_CAEEX|nr:hypothetical protein CEXT_40121 [Caerostris extrusa]